MASRLLLRAVSLAVLTLLAPAAVSGAGQSVTRLSAAAPDELKAALYGGECWAVACVDLGDGVAATLMTATAKLLDESDCHIGTLKCHAKLPSGQTALARLGLTVKKGHVRIR